MKKVSFINQLGFVLKSIKMYQFLSYLILLYQVDTINFINSEAIFDIFLTRPSNHCPGRPVSLAELFNKMSFKQPGSSS